MTWQDIEDIAVELYESHPDTDPLAVRFTDLLTWIGELPEFKDDLKRSNEQKLEAVQMEWYELWKEDHS
jgi:FeS assembly protein IscX